MNHDEAQEQLCKMVGEVAGRLGMSDKAMPCLCPPKTKYVSDLEVPDRVVKVIEEMWRRLTNPPDGGLRLGVLRKVVVMLNKAMVDIRSLDVKTGLGRIEQATSMLDGLEEGME